MDRRDLRRIAKETLEITKKGYYEYQGKRVDLIGENFDSVSVLSPERLSAIKEDEDEFFERAFWGTQGAAFYLIDCDSYEAACGLSHPLVMNFANALYPGGGFLNGAMAQEECLCRNSTLYASISSEKAREMYDYNQQHLVPMDSDYMLLSENVCVFRDVKGELVEEPSMVSVITVPAPNKYGRASNVPQEELDYVMKERLRKMLYAAARYDYKTLVLGAWGCGAFGHDTRTVARYYYDLFFEEGFNTFFDNVVFAIFKDTEKIEAFAEVFGDKIERADQVTSQKASKAYVEVKQPFPICNHQGANKNNVGYTLGILMDGTPFEAECWRDNESCTLGIVMPEKKAFYIEEKEREILKDDEDSVLGFHRDVEMYDDSILCQGMVDEGQEDELAVIQQYIDYLVSMGIVEFLGEEMNGSVFYRIDSAGHELVEINIMLCIDGNRLARTNLEFKPFENQHHSVKFEVIKNDSKK